MKPVDWERYKFKLRSLPNTKTFPRYFESAMYFLAALAGYNFIAICMFVDDFTLTMPAPFVLAIPIIFCNIYFSIENEYKNVNRDTMREAVVHIRLKQTQALIEKLENNPEILQLAYKKKSLLYWARYHQNLEANSIIIQMMKKTKHQSEKRINQQS